MIAATIAVQSQRYDPTGPGPSIIDIDCMRSAVAVQPASVSAVSAAGRRSVCGTLTRSWLVPASRAILDGPQAPAPDAARSVGGLLGQADGHKGVVELIECKQPD